MPTVSLGQATGQPLNTSIGDVTAEPWQQASATPKVSINASASYGQEDTGAGSFAIREITGPDLREVVLRERALPYKPIVFGGKHRIEETAYPGFPTKSQQALGAEENDSEFKGAWKTRFIGDMSSSAAMFRVTSASGTATIDGTEAIGIDSSQITDAATACEVLDDIRRKGQVCRVSWLHIVRVGRLEEFTQSWTTAHDVEWTMKWKWIGRDEDAGRPSPSSASLLAVSHDLSAGYVDLHDSTDFDGIASGLEPNIADQVDYRVGRIQRGVLELEDAIEQRASNAAAPADALRRALQLSTFLRDEAQALCDFIDQTVAPSLWLVVDTLRPIGAVVASTPPAQRDLRGVTGGQAVAAGIALRAAAVAARALKHKAARQRFAAIRQLESNALAVVVLAQNEDLQDLSLRYYGTPEDAEIIRAFNGLDTFAPLAGTVVVVPQRSREQ